MNPPTITPLKPSELHQYWPLLERGLNDIASKVKPDHLPEDVYAMLLSCGATCCIVTRETRILGFFVYHKQERPWSHKLDIFLWAGWTIPLRERTSSDDIPEIIQRSIEYLHEVKRSLAAERIIAVTSRRGAVRKFGLKELSFTVEL